MKKRRCMDCKDCHRYSFAQQHGPHARLQDGIKPMIRQCAAWQRYDRWRKRHGNALEYSAWHSTVDLHGPRYAADKDIRDQAMQFVTLSNVEKAKGWFDETLWPIFLNALTWFMCTVPTATLISMYKAEVRFIINDWQTLRACKELLKKCIEETMQTGDVDILPPSTKSQIIASATIADELEKISTREVKSWARYTIFILEYYVSQFEVRGWCQETADEFMQELESLADSIPIHQIECRWQRVGALARSHHVWTELQRGQSEMIEKIRITDSFEISHPMGNGSSHATKGRAAGD